MKSLICPETYSDIFLIKFYVHFWPCSNKLFPCLINACLHCMCVLWLCAILFIKFYYYLYNCDDNKIQNCINLDFFCTLKIETRMPKINKPICHICHIYRIVLRKSYTFIFGHGRSVLCEQTSSMHDVLRNRDFTVLYQKAPDQLCITLFLPSMYRKILKFASTLMQILIVNFVTKNRLFNLELFFFLAVKVL